jgi:hypothetical protein
VLDTEKWGQLHIRLTLGHPSVTTSNNGAHSWGIGDVYMRVKYYTNYNKELPKYIEFDDFKSLLTFSPNYNQTISLMVNSSRIDYALARTLRQDMFGKGSVYVADINSPQHFASFGFNTSSWNISVNNKELYRFTPKAEDALATIYDVFGNACLNSATFNDNSTKAFSAGWTCAAELGFQNEIPEQVEISFTTNGSFLTCHHLLIVKTTSSVEMNNDGSISHRT